MNIFICAFIFGKYVFLHTCVYLFSQMPLKRNLTNAALRKVWPWHSMFKICQITGKIGLQFCKLTILGVSDQANRKFAKVSECIKFGKGLLTSCVLDSLTSMIECR